MSDWKLFRLSLADHPGLSIGYMWPLMVAAAMLLNKLGPPPLVFWLAVYPVVSALPWVPIIYTAWSRRKQYDEVRHG